ncbi:MAG: Fe-S oxidoreductase, partial [Thermobifida sp.]|nr:Fe-S oxidoreductase [Thermobifida sp.]
MANPTLSAIMWGLALLVSAVAVLSFVRGLTHMWRTVSAGTPDPGRLTPVGKRLWGVISAALTHREFKGRPWIKAAHWLVMVSFPILFLTLVTGYAQLRVQTFTLPLLGHFAPWEWLTEVFAWGGLVGIILLMVVRQRAGRGTAAEAALSNDDPDAAAAAADPE